MKVENFKRFSLKMLRCEARAFPVGTPFFYSAENVHAYECGHISSGHFVLGREVLCDIGHGQEVCLQQKYVRSVKLLYL